MADKVDHLESDVGKYRRKERGESNDDQKAILEDQAGLQGYIQNIT